MWAGAKTVAHAAKPHGLEVETIEILDDPVQQDVSSECGFANGIDIVMKIAKGGLLHMAPVCSSFVFANSSKTKRTKENPEGDIEYAPVVSGNTMASVSMFYMLLAHARGLCENPKPCDREQQNQ